MAKLSPRDAPGYFAKPDPKRAGLLIYGPDAMRIAARRQQVIKALVGPDGEAEMRLTRMPGADLRKDAALLMDEMKAQGFFPGPRVVFVEEARDDAAPAIEAALGDWAEGDAQIIVTAGQLTKGSKLRKLFEGDPRSFAAAIYDDPPSRGEVEAALKAGGLEDVSTDAMAALLDLSRALEPGDFRQTVEKLALYKHGDATPVSLEDVASAAPQSIEAALDDILSIVAEGRVGEIGPMMTRLQAQGTTPVSLCIGATRHFRTLHAAASDPGGPGAGVGKLRPPVFGPRRDRVVRQAGQWGMHRLEKGLALLTETDLQLRSSSAAPQMALMERAMIRLAMMARR